MKFRIVGRWPSDDILPTILECDSAAAAISKHRALIKLGLEPVDVFAIENGMRKRVSTYRLDILSRAEKSKRRGSKAIAGALLSMIASALPNGFGDFGVVPTYGVLRVARISRIDARKVHRS
jgi:hypothetical protein